MHSRILRRALDAMADTATLLFASTPIRVCVLGWALVVTMSVQSMSQAVSARTNTGRLLPTPPAVVPALTPPATQSRRGSSPDQGILIADVDENLPRTTMQNPDAVAVIIGNAAYEKTKPSVMLGVSSDIWKRCLDTARETSSAWTMPNKATS
jgi:hypothetical protein